MSIEVQLKQLALAMATDTAMRLNVLRSQLQDIERQKLELQKKIETASQSSKRAEEFRPKSGIDYLCPRCWVQHCRNSLLRPIPSTTRQDIFRCGSCGAEFSLDP
ncbi:hypothetical protein [Bradyrhizobium sp. UNPA324]|uniref:hypothetical protein n=1 Tax=Bradyrhizobium sp. UNPA324 TaxID=1141174 RepID=UPI001153C890|nr:hypothetical protein [Bradyrhizobium sp. UNPA324]